MKKSYRFLFIGAACLSASIAILPLNADAASVSITGTLGQAAQGYKVLLVSSTGSAIVSTANEAGKFNISASKTAVKGATLQMVDANNRYVGPIVLAKEALGKRRVPT